MTGSNCRVGMTVSALAVALAMTPTRASWAADAPARTAGAAAMTPTPLIPRTVFFGNPDRASPQVSPDGRQLAFLAARDGVLNVFVAPIDSPDAARPVTNDTRRGIRQYFWAPTSEHLIYLQDQGGNENWRVFSVDLGSGAVRDLTPFDGVAARIEGVSSRFPDEILVGLNNRVPALHDLHRVNIRTGAMRLVLENQGFLGFDTDDDFRVRFASRFNPDGTIAVLKNTAQPGQPASFEPFETIPTEDTNTTSSAGFTTDGTIQYMLDSRGRNTAALFEVDMKTGARTLLVEDPRADVGGTLRHPMTGRVLAASVTWDRRRWVWLDEQVRAAFNRLNSLINPDNAAELQVMSWSDDMNTWIVALTVEDGPARFFRYTRGGDATFLFSNRRALEGLELARMHPVVIRSRDGLELVSYLTLPPWTDADRNARPDAAPLPMVLLVHGGPWARDSWGYNPQHQMLANRGYAVLSVNFRGSTGFGKDFLNAGDREWAGKMHDDLIDGVNWAIENNVAARDRVAIMGGSYGGYAALVGLTFTPDVFAAGVSIVGPSNLVTLLNTIPPYWAPVVQMFKNRVGDHTTEEGRAFLKSRSPLTFVDRIERPLLIGQGANDPRVRQAESDQIVAAMKARNIPVTYVLFPDEGHGFARPENNLAFFAVAEQFLAAHLGGRAEPVGDSVAASTAQIKVVGETLPGLPSEAAPATP